MTGNCPDYCDACEDCVDCDGDLDKCPGKCDVGEPVEIESPCETCTCNEDCPTTAGIGATIIACAFKKELVGGIYK